MFNLLDKSVFYTFVRGHLVGGLQHGNANPSRFSNASNVHIVSLGKEGKKAELKNINNSKKDKESKNNNFFHSSKEDKKKINKKDNDNNKAVMNAV